MQLKLDNKSYEAKKCKAGNGDSYYEFYENGKFIFEVSLAIKSHREMREIIQVYSMGQHNKRLSILVALGVIDENSD